jgi:hypothetical protein
LYTYGWKGKKQWNFYKVKPTQENDMYSVLESLKESYSYTDGKYEEYDTCKVKKGYYEGYYNSEDAKKTTKEAVITALGKLVPNKEKLETTIKNTKENREKYFDNLKQFKKF